MSMTKQEERRVIAAVLAGDVNRFEELVLAHQNRIYALCSRMLGNAQDASDAAQETFFRAYRALASFRGDSRFSTWLCRLGSNICLDMLRKRPDVPDLSLEDDDGRSWDLPSQEDAPQEALERKELRRAVQEGLLQLPPEFRQVLLLREVGGLSYDEIARAAKLEPGTVKSRIARARKKLAAILLSDGNFGALYSSYRTENDFSAKGGEDA